MTVWNHAWLGSLFLTAVMVLMSPAEAAEIERTGGPYVPTPQVVVDQMLNFANVGPDDFVMDLGSGDGVIVLTAARQLRARGMGVDIDPELVRLSNETAKHLGVADRAAFKVQDVFKADLSRVTVLTLYLLPEMMVALQSKILNELKPGTRVVSHDYDLGDWQPDDQITFDVPEKENVTGVPQATVYLWIVPAKVAGRWRVQIDGVATPYEIEFKQRFQMIEGRASSGGKIVPVQLATLRGESVHFAITAGAGRHVFSGHTNGATMKGTVELATGKGASSWSATRMDGQTSAQ